MTHCFSGILPLYIVTEYPKSGGSWFSQLLAEYLEIPFPQNQFPRFRSSIMHGHYLFFPTLKNVFVILRDGRDVMVSFYYHSFFENDRYNARLVAETRRRLKFENYEDIGTNLPVFIEYAFTRNRRPRFNWADFVNSWKGRDQVAVKYEDMLKDTTEALRKALQEKTGREPDSERLVEISEKYSFRRLTKRKPGEEKIDSFLRKGVAGDWKNHFNKEAREVFDHYAGQELIGLGYEADRTWV